MRSLRLNPLRFLSCLLFKTGFSAKRTHCCASEADWKAGESPVRRVRLFTTEHDLNSVAARRGWKLRKRNRRAITKVNHI